MCHWQSNSAIQSFKKDFKYGISNCQSADVSDFYFMDQFELFLRQSIKKQFLGQ